MQIGEEDYYETNDMGCCLHCENSYKGCLCYECKCTKCYWYTPPAEYDGEKGHCDKADELSIIRKKNIRKEFLIKDYLNYEKSKILKNSPNKKNTYSCQKCSREFSSIKELKIIKGKEPICDICLGKITLTKETLNKINKEVEKILQNE